MLKSAPDQRFRDLEANIAPLRRTGSGVRSSSVRCGDQIRGALIRGTVAGSRCITGTAVHGTGGTEILAVLGPRE